MNIHFRQEKVNKKNKNKKITKGKEIKYLILPFQLSKLYHHLKLKIHEENFWDVKI